MEYISLLKKPCLLVSLYFNSPAQSMISMPDSFELHIIFQNTIIEIHTFFFSYMRLMCSTANSDKDVVLICNENCIIRFY